MATEPRKTRTLDVRSLIRRGEEPFTKIMAAIAALAPQEDLLLVTPFLPAPLIEKLRSEGFETRPEHRSDGSWQTRFTRT
jgi:uncharacterized protein (DUF2249 family)